MRIKLDDVRGIGLRTGIGISCSLLYDAATSLGISHHIGAQNNGMAFSTEYCNQSAYNPIIDDNKSSPFLKAVKEKAKALAKKLMPGIEELNQTTYKELKVIELLNYIKTHGKASR